MVDFEEFLDKIPPLKTANKLGTLLGLAESLALEVGQYKKLLSIDNISWRGSDKNVARI